jgi:hypothetical protein
MPFDISGNFTRSYNFQQDRDNGIKILASHFDGEFDNYATGMNLVFFRDGRVPMQADLRMNVNGIIGLKDGTLGTPAIKFNTDTTTGPYLDGISRYAIQVNSTQRLVAHVTGVDITGNLAASGNLTVAGSITQAGSPVATQAFVAGAYVPFTGGTLSGNVTAPVFLTSGAGGGVLYAPRDGTTTQKPVIYAPTSGQLNFYNGSADVFTLTSSLAQFNGSITSGNVVSCSGAGGAFSVVPRNAATPAPLIYSPVASDLRINNGAGADIATFTTGNASVNGSISIFSSTLPNLNLTKTGSFAGTAQLLNDGGTQLITGAAGQSIQIRGDTIRLRNRDISVDFLTIDGTSAQFQQYAQANGADATYSTGFKHSRTGQVGYYMYNGGAVAEWITYQPAHATGDDYRIAVGSGGSLFDKLKLDPSGNLWVAANITSASDARLKTGVRDLENGLAIVKALRARRYIKDGKADLGVVAQEVEKYIPEVVQTDNRGYKSVDYGRLVTPLLAAVQALDERISRIESALVL